MRGQPDLFGEIIVDNFAGGGGASTGIELATGRVVDIAINHDPDAILMHKTWRNSRPGARSAKASRLKTRRGRRSSSGSANWKPLVTTGSGGYSELVIMARRQPASGSFAWPAVMVSLSFGPTLPTAQGYCLIARRRKLSTGQYLAHQYSSEKSRWPRRRCGGSPEAYRSLCWIIQGHISSPLAMGNVMANCPGFRILTNR